MQCYSRSVVLLLAVIMTAAESRVGNKGNEDDVASADSRDSLGLNYRGAHNKRQQKIVDMMRHAWKGYASNCWGSDEFSPVTRECGKGWKMGLTMIDGLDTLYLMGMDKEFKEARDWVADKKKLDFGRVGNVNLFETTIRVVGGLLGAHAVSGDPIFLERAEDLGKRLLPAMRGQNNIPFSDVDVGLREGFFGAGDASTAEATTLGLEFRALSLLSRDPIYAQTVNRIGKHVHGLSKRDGLVTNHLSPKDGDLSSDLVSLGSRGDSYYEYLLKQWLQSGKRDPSSLQDYLAAMEGVQKHLIKTTNGTRHLTYVAELDYGGVRPKMDHLVCFLPGLLALGSHNGLSKEHLTLAEKIIDTCHQMYTASGRNLGPEIAFFDTEGQELYIKPQDAHDLLRPETVESLFYLYRITGDKKYQDWGWDMAQAIDKYAKVDGGGYTSLDSVFNLKKRNKMESFFLGETLKYLFLLFDDSQKQVPLDKFVFNTEGHPLRIEHDVEKLPLLLQSEPAEVSMLSISHGGEQRRSKSFLQPRASFLAGSSWM